MYNNPNTVQKLTYHKSPYGSLEVNFVWFAFCLFNKINKNSTISQQQHMGTFLSIYNGIDVNASSFHMTIYFFSFFFSF